MRENIDFDTIRRLIVSTFGDEFVVRDDTGAVASTSAFEHVPSGLGFRYIPGGQFLMGFSDKEELAARAIADPFPSNISEMRPVHQVTVPPFLISERPVLTSEIRGEESSLAAYVSYEEALAYGEQFGMTLPKEAQWEYACRAGSNTLFTWGDHLPDDEELEDWLTLDFGQGYGKANAFGLYGLFVGEWCVDLFTESYDLSVAPDNKNEVRVVRGGGAYFWPWQDEEWVWCMSAMRLPATDLPEGECGFRLVRNI